MQIPIFQIKVNEGRRGADQKAVQDMADSISKVGLLNPITVDQEYILIAGLHRLEAAKRLGWAEIECTVSSLEGLEATLAEIDENFIHKDLSDVEFRELLLRRKEIYETLHPETKAGIAQALSMNKTLGNNVTAPSAATIKTFVDDTADKTGMAPRTVREELQIAKNLTPEAQEILQSSGTKIKKKDTIKLSRLVPDQQKEAAHLLAAKQIRSVEEYHAGPVTPTKDTPEFADQLEQLQKPPELQEELDPEVPRQTTPSPVQKPGRFATFAENVADLKNPNKDCSCTPDTFVAEFNAYIQQFIQGIQWYITPDYRVVFPALSQVQINYLRELVVSICDTVNNIFHQIEGSTKE